MAATKIVVTLEINSVVRDLLLKHVDERRADLSRIQAAVFQAQENLDHFARNIAMRPDVAISSDTTQLPSGSSAEVA